MRHLSKQNYLIAFFSLCTYAFNIQAQVPVYKWAESFGGVNREVAYSIASDDSGNVVIAGTYQKDSLTIGGFTLPYNTNFTNIFVAKYDSSGNVLWAKSGNSTSATNAQSICVDQYGDIYITGWFNNGTLSFGSFILTNSSGGGTDLFAIKLDHNGTVVWGNTVDGGLGNVIGNSIVVSESDEVYITGKFSDSTIVFGGDILINVNPPKYDILLLKYSISGGEVWGKRYGGTLDDIGTTLTTDKKNHVLLVGDFQSDSITFGSNKLFLDGLNDMYVTKIDTSGNTIWANSPKAVPTVNPYSITTDSSNAIYVSGKFTGDSLVFDSITLYNNGTESFFLVKYDSGGSDLWGKNNPNFAWWDIAYSVSTDNSGNVIMIGSFDSPTITFGSTVFNNTGIGNDMFIVKYNGNGNLIWAETTGGNNDDFGYSVSVNKLGNIFIGGYFQSSVLNIDTFALPRNGAGYTDVFLSMLEEVPCLNSYYSYTTTACNNFQSPSGNHNWSSSGLYTDTIPNQSGCDSIITIDLTVNTQSTYTINPTACDSYTSPSGNYSWSTNGTYQDTIPNSVGCDSILTINLSMINIDTSITNSSPTLMANVTGATYQWLDCNNSMAIISGATNKNFTATANGSYAVSVTKNGCVDTSSCHQVNNVGIIKNNFGNGFALYPNPTDRYFFIKLGATYSDVTVILKNVIGQEILNKTFASTSKLDLEIVDKPGVYFLEISTGEKSAILKVIKN